MGYHKDNRITRESSNIRAGIEGESAHDRNLSKAGEALAAELPARAAAMENVCAEAMATCESWASPLIHYRAFQ